MRVAMFALALAACTTTSQIGPYVKSVARNGAWLAVERCMIVLQGNTLAEGTCTLEQLPLGSIPQGPPLPTLPAQPTVIAPAPGR